ncbi:MAG: FtsX-like permease family protein [Gammaproteobacteria bacterium]|nr:FtsX-like permease family protein [Gammaproteobacteria bacterium]
MNLLLRSHLRHLWRDRWQTLLAVFGIAIGVAVVLAVDLANAASREAMRVATQQLDGSATHAITGAGERLAESAYPALRLSWRQGDERFADVRAMAPVVTAEVRLARAPEEGEVWPMQLLGVDPVADAGMRATVPGPASGAAGRLISEPGTVLVDVASLRRLGIDPDAEATLWVRSAAGIRPVRMIASFSLGERALGQGLMIADIATAQELLDRVGWLSRIDLERQRAAPAAGWAVLLERLFPGLVIPPPASDERDLGGGLREVSLAEQAADTRALAASFQLNLAALGLLALLVGLFLVHGALTHAVMRRARSFGRLRALGVQAAEIHRMVLAEAAVMGVLGVLAGLVIGRWLARALLLLVAGTLENLYGQVAVAALAPDPVPMVKAASVGIMATLLAALPAASRASQVAPNGRSLGVQRADASRRAALIALLIVAGAAALHPRLGYAGGLLAVGAVLLTAAVLTPAWMRTCLRLLLDVLKLAPLQVRLLLRDSERGLLRSGVAASALVIAMATALGMGLMVESFRSSVDRWLDARLAAPLHLQFAGEHRELPEAVADLLPQTVRGHVFRVTWSDRVGGQPVRVSRISVTGEVPEDLGLAMVAGRFGPQGVAISEPLSRRLQKSVGATLSLPVAGGALELPITGVFREYGAGPGLILVADGVVAPLLAGSAALELHGPRGDLDGVVKALAAAAPEGARIRHNEELLALARGVFDRTFRVTSVLQAIAGAVAAFGLFAALTALGLERRTQYGVLRTLGVDRRTPVLQNLGEALLLAAAAVLLAMPLGVGVAVILIEVVNVRAFGWSLDWQFPPWLFLQALLISLLAGLLAAALPAWSLYRATPAALMQEVRADA